MFNNSLPVKTLLALAIVSLLFARCGQKKYAVYYKDFQNYRQLNLQDDSSVLAYSSNQTVSTKPLQLEKGKYQLKFRAKGTIAAGVLPILFIQFEKYSVKYIAIKEGTGDYDVNFELPETTTGPLSLSFTNEYSSPTENRVLHIYLPLIINSY